MRCRLFPIDRTIYSSFFQTSAGIVDNTDKASYTVLFLLSIISVQKEYFFVEYVKIVIEKYSSHLKRTFVKMENLFLKFSLDLEWDDRTSQLR